MAMELTTSVENGWLALEGQGTLLVNLLRTFVISHMH